MIIKPYTHRPVHLPESAAGGGATFYFHLGPG
jgi:hypothetical protein